MKSLKDLIKKLHKYDRESNFVKVLFNAVWLKLQKVYNFVEGLKCEFFFDTLTEFSVNAYEKLLKITTYSGATLDERRSAIRAKWRANGKNTVQLIQDVCDSWSNGEILASFTKNKMLLKFVGSYGIPSASALNALITQVVEIIPAHIGYYFQYKFLLKKEIHHVLTKSEMQNLTKNKYCEVKINE